MRTLVIGDDRSLTNKISEILKGNGFAANDLRICLMAEAVEILRQGGADLVVAAMCEDTSQNLALLSEWSRASSAEVLAVGIPDDPKFILRALREGAREFLDRNELEAELQTSLARLGLRRAERDENGGTIVGVLGASGGSGASTISANLAVVLAQRHERSAIIDLRLGACDQELLLDLKPRYTMAELCGDGERVDRGLFQQYLTRHSSGTYLLAAPPLSGDLTHVTSDGVHRALSIARSCFPYVVIDLDRVTNTQQQAALGYCDAILLTMRLDMISLRSTRRTMEFLERLEIPSAKIHVAINRYGQAKELPYRQAEQALAAKNIYYVPEDTTWMNSCVNQGIPLVLERPKSKAAKAIVAIADRMEQLQQQSVVQSSHDQAVNSTLRKCAASVM